MHRLSYWRGYDSIHLIIYQQPPVNVTGRHNIMPKFNNGMGHIFLEDTAIAQTNIYQVSFAPVYINCYKNEVISQRKIYFLLENK